jgi:hypothetical protein
VAKLSIGSNEFPNDYGFISNRVFQAIAPGGAMFLQQHVPGLLELTGLESGKHYIEWSDFDDLLVKIDYWLDPANEKQRKKIAKAGAKYVREHHSFDARVRQLFTDLLPLAKKQPRFVAALRYIGPCPDPFGVIGPETKKQYICYPDQPLHVAPEDADIMLTETHRWQKTETPQSKVVSL